MENKIPSPPKIEKKMSKETMFVSITTILVLGFLLGVVASAFVFFQQAENLLDHVKIESVVISVNETSIMQTFFKELDRRGINITEALNNGNKTNTTS